MRTEGTGQTELTSTDKTIWIVFIFKDQIQICFYILQLNFWKAISPKFVSQTLNFNVKKNLEISTC